MNPSWEDVGWPSLGDCCGCQYYGKYHLGMSTLLVDVTSEL